MYKVSIIIPCLFKPELLDMIKKCISGLSLDCQVILIGNDGYAVNVNNGLRAATGDYLVICNNDIEFIQDGWLDHLLKPLKEGYDISSIRTSGSDGWTVEDKITEDDYFGSIWAITREVYETIGGLDEAFIKGTFEDKDYYNRAKSAGFRIGKNHAGLVLHEGRATNKIVFPNYEDFTEGKEVYFKKYGRID